MAEQDPDGGGGGRVPSVDEMVDELLRASDGPVSGDQIYDAVRSRAPISRAEANLFLSKMHRMIMGGIQLTMASPDEKIEIMRGFLDLAQEVDRMLVVLVNRKEGGDDGHS